jgi:hypothetical protein
MSITPTALTPDAETPLGRQLLQRIVLREKLRVQVQFLEELARIPACRELTLYLHARLSDDLDFLAPPDLAESFPTLLVAHGLMLEPRPGLVPAYTRVGTLGTPIGIGVDMCVRPGPEMPAEVRPFGFLAGRTVPVRVLPLAEMLAEKLDCISRRARAVDFLDLWLGFGHGPEMVQEAFAALRRRQPPLLWDPALALDHLASLRADWNVALGSCLMRVPNYDQVWKDVKGWLHER